MKEIERIIKNRLMDLDMSIEELAKKSGLSKGTVHTIFNTGDARLSQLDAISKALNMTVNELMGMSVVQEPAAEYTLMKKDDLLKLYERANGNLELENARLKNREAVLN
jgi:transcriptional regulator with XRE-family HTH domain